MVQREVLKHIGRNISSIRREKGIKGETLAKELRVTKAAVSQMENGQVDFKISALSSIASFLGANFTSLIDEDDCIKLELVQYQLINERNSRTINLLVCRIEYLQEQIECMKIERNKITSSEVYNFPNAF